MACLAICSTVWLPCRYLTFLLCVTELLNVKKSVRACFPVKNMLGVCLAKERVIETKSSNLVPNLGWNADYDAWLDSSPHPLPHHYHRHLPPPPSPSPPLAIPQIYCFKSTASQHDSIMQSILLGWLFPPRNIRRYENLAWPIYFDLGKQLCLVAKVCRVRSPYITPAAVAASTPQVLCQYVRMRACIETINRANVINAEKKLNRPIIFLPPPIA